MAIGYGVGMSKNFIHNYIGIILFLPCLGKMHSDRKNWFFSDHACLFSHEITYVLRYVSFNDILLIMCQLKKKISLRSTTTSYLHAQLSVDYFTQY